MEICDGTDLRSKASCATKRKRPPMATERSVAAVALAVVLAAELVAVAAPAVVADC